MMTPKVAVITRTKNRPFLLERALKSVMGQSFGDLLMVIVNDGGDVRPIESLVEKHKELIKGRIKIIDNQTSVGMERASNKGIRASKSEYIAMLDDDDTWHPDFLKETINRLENSEYKGVVTGSEIIQEIIEDETVKTVGSTRFAPEISQIRLFNLSGVNQFPNNSFVYVREVLAKIGDYDQEAPVLGDWDFNRRFLSLYDIGFIDKPLANYHHRYSEKGPMGNSLSSHAEIYTKLLNRYLRDDLNKGVFGLGVLANLSSSHREIIAELETGKALTRELFVVNDKLQAEILKSRTTLEDIEKRLRIMEKSNLSKIKENISKVPRKIMNKSKKDGRI